MKQAQTSKKQPKEYFEKLLEQTHSHDNVSKIIKNTQDYVQSNIEQGSLKIADQLYLNNNEDLTAHLLQKKEINPFDSRYNRFLLNTDREKSQERFEIFKKIKEEYSKQKTAIVVKEVENKIKQWTAKKLEIQKRQQRSNEHKKKIQTEMIEQLKRQQLQKKEMEAFRRKQELLKRIKLLQQKKEKREQFLKQSSIRTREIKEPKFKQIQQKFTQIQQKIKQEQQKFLVEKRQSLTVTKQERLEHQKKYEQIRKEKQQQRIKKAKYKIKHDQSSDKKQDFDAYNLQHKIQNKEGQEKLKRIKQFSQKVKSMINLVKVNTSKQQNAQKESKQPLQNTQKESKQPLQKASSVKDISSQIKLKLRKSQRSEKRQLNTSADPRVLGNNYLRALKQQGKQLLGRSVSLPKIMPTEVSSKPTYKNYMTEVKVKARRKQANDEIEKVKTSGLSKVQVLSVLAKKSNEYEENMLKKIKELGRIDKYNDSVQKQSEIDQLHARYLKLRLACLD